jgi:hypothetical protein
MRVCPSLARSDAYTRLMKIDYVATLQRQRDLYSMPRDMERFRAYIRELTGGGDDLELPLVGFNPMGREHVTEALDQLIAAGADDAAREASVRAASELPAEETLRSTLVLSDDIGGMWTHRRTSELGRRWGKDPLLARGWVVPLVWTSDALARDALEREVRSSVYRAAFRLAYGEPTCLRDVLLQEGFGALFAGVQPTGDAHALDAHALDRFLEAHDTATVFAALFGDAAAAEMGYAALGVGEDGGFAVAAALAAASRQTPVDWLRT